MFLDFHDKRNMAWIAGGLAIGINLGILVGNPFLGLVVGVIMGVFISYSMDRA